MPDQIEMFPPPDQTPPRTAAPPSDTASDASDNDNRVTVRLDAEAATHLQALLGAARDQSAAIRYALRVAAGVAQGAWGMGLVPPTQLPEPIAHRVAMPGRLPADIHLQRPAQPAAPARPVAPYRPHPAQQAYRYPYPRQASGGVHRV